MQNLGNFSDYANMYHQEIHKNKQNPEQNPGSRPGFPTNMLAYILKYCSVEEIINFSSTCKTANHFVENNKILFKAEFQLRTSSQYHRDIKAINFKQRTLAEKKIEIESRINPNSYPLDLNYRFEIVNLSQFGKETTLYSPQAEIFHRWKNIDFYYRCGHVVGMDGDDKYFIIDCQLPKDFKFSSISYSGSHLAVSGYKNGLPALFLAELSLDDITHLAELPLSKQKNIEIIDDKIKNEETVNQVTLEEYNKTSKKVNLAEIEINKILIHLKETEESLENKTNEYKLLLEQRRLKIEKKRELEENSNENKNPVEKDKVEGPKDEKFDQLQVSIEEQIESLEKEIKEINQKNKTFQKEKNEIEKEIKEITEKLDRAEILFKEEKEKLSLLEMKKQVALQPFELLQVRKKELEKITTDNLESKEKVNKILQPKFDEVIVPMVKDESECRSRIITGAEGLWVRELCKNENVWVAQILYFDNKEKKLVAYDVPRQFSGLDDHQKRQPLVVHSRCNDIFKGDKWQSLVYIFSSEGHCIIYSGASNEPKKNVTAKTVLFDMNLHGDGQKGDCFVSLPTKPVGNMDVVNSFKIEDVLCDEFGDVHLLVTKATIVPGGGGGVFGVGAGTITTYNRVIKSFPSNLDLKKQISRPSLTPQITNSSKIVKLIAKSSNRFIILEHAKLGVVQGLPECLKEYKKNVWIWVDDSEQGKKYHILASSGDTAKHSGDILLQERSHYNVAANPFFSGDIAIYDDNYFGRKKIVPDKPITSINKEMPTPISKPIETTIQKVIRIFWLVIEGCKEMLMIFAKFFIVALVTKTVASIIICGLFVFAPVYIPTVALVAVGWDGINALIGH